MLQLTDMRLPDRFLRFHSSKRTVAFLSRNVSILHTLTTVSDFSDEQRKTNMRLLLVELGFPNGNGRHRYKLHLVKWLTLENEKKIAVSQEWRRKKEKS